MAGAAEENRDNGRGWEWFCCWPRWLPHAGLIAQWTSNRGYQLLQRVDDVLFGVDNLALVILDRRHVAGTLLRINVQQPARSGAAAEFVVDCEQAAALCAAVPATMPAGRSRKRLEFSPAQILDGTWFAAEFACEVTRQPGSAARLARDLFERGGPQDMQTMYCELQPDGSDRPGRASRCATANPPMRWR
jgi:hypothetical protein